MENQIEKKTSELGLSLLSHDIKNIFNNISSSIELCKIYLNDSHQKNKVSEQFNIVHGQIIRGIKLVSNARKLSEFDEQSSLKKRKDIYPILNKAINFTQKSFKDKKVNIKVKSFSKTLFVDIDENISEVFENVLFNAVLHNMNINVDISVNITKEQKDNNKFLKLEFSDNGIGVSDNRKEWIFKDSFKKGSGKGLGFGLTLVKKIIENYGGFMWVEDRVKGDYSQGSNFVVLLPS